MLGGVLYLALGVTAMEAAAPKAASLPEAKLCTFPMERPADTLFFPAYSFDEEELRLHCPFTFEGVLLEVPEASRSGIDPDAVPRHLGISFNAFPARFTGVYVEGLRISSDGDFSGTNVDILPAGVVSGL